MDPSPQAHPGAEQNSNSATNPHYTTITKVSIPAFEPSPVDVVVARLLLARGLHLPMTLVEDIIDWAEYWPSLTCENSFHPLTVYGSSEQEDHLLLRCPPICLSGQSKIPEWETPPQLVRPTPLKREFSRDHFEKMCCKTLSERLHPVRKIIYSVLSHDQGWGPRPSARTGPYHNSYSWFEVGLERFDRDADCPETADPEIAGPKDEKSIQIPFPLPLSALRSIHPELAKGEGESYAVSHNLLPNPLYLVQRNVPANREWTLHEVVWSWSDYGDSGSEDDLRDNPDTAQTVPSSQKPVDFSAEFGTASQVAAGNFVRSLRLGDVLTIWGKARFPGWQNIVRSVKVKIYWAV